MTYIYEASRNQYRSVCVVKGSKLWDKQEGTQREPMFSVLQAAFPSQHIRVWTQEPGTEARWGKARTRHWTDHHIEHVIGATGVTKWWLSGRQSAGLVRCLAADSAPQNEAVAVIQVGSWCQRGPYVDRLTAVGTAWWGEARRPWVLATHAASNPGERRSWDKNRAQWFRHLPSESRGKLDAIIWAAFVTGHAGILMVSTQRMSWKLAVTRQERLMWSWAWPQGEKPAVQTTN